MISPLQILINIYTEYLIACFQLQHDVIVCWIEKIFT